MRRDAVLSVVFCAFHLAIKERMRCLHACWNDCREHLPPFVLRQRAAVVVLRGAFIIALGCCVALLALAALSVVHDDEDAAPLSSNVLQLWQMVRVPPAPTAQNCTVDDDASGAPGRRWLWQLVYGCPAAEIGPILGGPA